MAPVAWKTWSPIDQLCRNQYSLTFEKKNEKMLSFPRLHYRWPVIAVAFWARTWWWPASWRSWRRSRRGRRTSSSPASPSQGPRGYKRSSFSSLTKVRIFCLFYHSLILHILSEFLYLLIIFIWFWGIFLIIFAEIFLSFSFIAWFILHIFFNISTKKITS